jgi:carotene isomerase
MPQRLTALTEMPAPIGPLPIDPLPIDMVVIGSGIGGLVAAALLARYGKRVLVCESHSIAGGAAHAFTRDGFEFDSGPSFYCGLADPNSLNPLRQVLAVLDEPIATVPYDPLGFYHFPDRTLPIWGDLGRYQGAIAAYSTEGAAEFGALAERLLALYQGLSGIPTLALRSDWKLLPFLLRHYPRAIVKFLGQLKAVQGSAGQIADQTVTDPWVRYLFELECFLLSGMSANETVAPEMAFMFGERTGSVIDYPIGGSGAIVAALVRGLVKFGGELRLKAHVEQILVVDNQVQGVRLKSGETITAPIVISNATLWDTYQHLLKPEDLPAAYRETQLATPAIDSFMHLHLGIRAEGLDPALAGHHVVVHDASQPVTVPNNVCMISIPSVWDPQLAPPGQHVVHAYTLESAAGWVKDADYAARKRQRSEILYTALRRVIPDIRDRVVLELIGTPLTHARFLRRYHGTYGPGIAAGQGMFPSCRMPIRGLYRVGDSTTPGIGVPAVAASGILCANALVAPGQTRTLLQALGLL